ncbi:MAG TPA: hypothetical protein VFV38_10215 [Ktedonobacteraceae bacterium]|nr:hypothetical protein [Ktedonobacteraceae bacterium]
MAHLFPVDKAVSQAFACMYWEDVSNKVYYETFISHWGGLDLEHMRRALDNGEGEEKVLAIFALGLSAAAGTADLLAPLLYQASRMERWASGICLGLMHDSRAFPVLESLLLDGLDTEEYIRVYTLALREQSHTRTHEQNWYAVYRWYAIQLLENWDSPTLLPTFKQTYAALWRIQQRLLPYRWLEVSNYDAIAYALGQRKTSTLLDEVDVPSEYRNVARIYMALGHLHAQASSGTELAGLPSRISGLGHEMLVNETLQQEVAITLGQLFGLSLAEQEESLDHFFDDAHFRSTYGHRTYDQLTEVVYDEDGDEN